MQRRGLQAMLESGRVSGPMSASTTSTSAATWTSAIFRAPGPAFTNAIAAGYTENGVEALLADAYINDNQVAEGLRILQQATAKPGRRCARRTGCAGA